MPQYTLKQYQTFKDQFDINVVEVNNYSNEYTVQRKQFANLFQLHGNQQLLPELLSEADIVHFQEIPESFLNRDVIDQIYNKERKYNIFVTTHSSLSRRKDFTHIPDKIIAVNEWQKKLFEKELPESKVDVWEYPIESNRPDSFQKFTAKATLNFPDEKDWPHYNILNVGLFTPGKNQGELFEIARKNPQNLYHFVGNQAGNFKDYWEPLMKNKPDNCIIWGERDDVDLFYMACDEMYFTSLFELNPICVKEALSYGMPVKMRKLETYGDFYDNNPLVTYI